MNTEELLLRDIHLPGPVSWWPPAIGWWLLVGSILCLLVAGAWWRRRTLATRNAPATIARVELDRLRAAWSRHGDDQQLVGDLSTWLRRAGMSLSSRQQAAGLTGEQWWRYLDKIAGEPIFDEATGRFLVQAPYQSAPVQNHSLDGQLLLEQCTRWLDAAARRKYQR